MWLVWWAWPQYTWAGNAIDLDRPATAVGLLAVSAAVLVAAVSLPDAFADRGAWFAVPYCAVRMAGLAVYWAGLRDGPDHRAALRTYLPVAVVSPLLVLAGGLAAADARPWLWARPSGSTWPASSPRDGASSALRPAASRNGTP